ncbi:ATP-binding cassette domain-containing protein [Horticoccus luteus]|uniref:ATP-binding cassette domain-containing protein n=1 Tax=Horticoccus luteus TaxID=2862869 RepID=A0A8F9TTF5_9BACT|nr:ATP-binding cassette domain-containing protein [Horticoccus luteus]QYM78929.1 ATP-binding cassette domain-containing protein [Horticoccus luteus]
MLFALRHVTFAYRRGAAPVLHDFSQDFPAGLTILRGPSGGGKSTLLKLLAGYLAPAAGTVTTRHGRAPDAAFQRHDVGFVFQQFNLLPGVSLQRNLELAGLIGGVPPAVLAARVQHWLDRMGLQPWSATRVEQLSGGQIQRAALARALVKAPAVLLLDEPTSGLDDTNTALIAALARDWLAAGNSVIVSTHDPRLPATLGDATALTLELPAA